MHGAQKIPEPPQGGRAGSRIYRDASRQWDLAHAAAESSSAVDRRASMPHTC
jgi:hypothetical protein